VWKETGHSVQNVKTMKLWLPNFSEAGDLREILPRATFKTNIYSVDTFYVRNLRGNESNAIENGDDFNRIIQKEKKKEVKRREETKKKKRNESK